VHTLTVITGYGSHSNAGQAKIKPAVSCSQSLSMGGIVLVSVMSFLFPHFFILAMSFIHGTEMKLAWQINLTNYFMSSLLMFMGCSFSFFPWTLGHTQSTHLLLGMFESWLRICNPDQPWMEVASGSWRTSVQIIMRFWSFFLLRYEDIYIIESSESLINKSCYFKSFSLLIDIMMKAFSLLSCAMELVKILTLFCNL